MSGEPRTIEPEEARAKGVWAEHSQMPNGELRFRLKHRDGTAYSRTEAAENSGWQNSHFHRSIRETYIVQRGRMALAELVVGALKMRVFGPGEICTTEPNVSHNVYLYRGSVIHTVKHGDGGDAADWQASPLLDELTAHLSETDILRLSHA
jgi:mannose-6-phosphate isomerase-like protein (cupin superfamily)